jgi:hypothetical protein
MGQELHVIMYYYYLRKIYDNNWGRIIVIRYLTKTVTSARDLEPRK